MKRLLAGLALALLAVVLLGQGTDGRTAPAVNCDMGWTPGRMWIDPDRLMGLPTGGQAWENVKQAADTTLPDEYASVIHRSTDHDTFTLAAALVAARLQDEDYRAKVRRELERPIGTEDGPLEFAGNYHNPIGRNTPSYVLAADLIDLKSYDPEFDQRFRAWIQELRDHPHHGETPVRLIHEQRSNNHGTMTGAATAAVSIYLGDTTQLARTAQVFKGWMGDRSAHTFTQWQKDAFTFMPDTANPVPLNPAGATVQGHDLDGGQPSELMRCGPFRWPPCKTIYPWGGLGGAIVGAELLRRHGYPDVFEWQDRAILRGYQWLDRTSRVDPFWWQRGYTGDENSQPWLVNHIYGTDFPAFSPTQPGRNIGWTDWTHAR